jgi:hypothetical protein
VIACSVDPGCPFEGHCLYAGISDCPTGAAWGSCFCVD